MQTNKTPFTAVVVNAKSTIPAFLGFRRVGKIDGESTSERHMVEINHTYNPDLEEGLYYVDAENNLVPMLHGVDYWYKFDRGHQFEVRCGDTKIRKFVVVNRVDERMTPLRAMCWLCADGFYDIMEAYNQGRIDRAIVQELQASIKNNRPLDMNLLKSRGLNTKTFVPEHVIAQAA